MKSAAPLARHDDFMSVGADRELERWVASAG
jgi:hypothetical protein